MRRRKAYISSALAVLVFLCCVPAFSASPDNVPRITVQELKAKMDKGEAIVIVDVRTGHEYDSSPNKIMGAVRISIFQLDEKYRELPQDKEIVTYCT